jgi:hypothetical protein
MDKTTLMTALSEINKTISSVISKLERDSNNPALLDQLEDSAERITAVKSWLFKLASEQASIQRAANANEPQSRGSSQTPAKDQTETGLRGKPYQGPRNTAGEGSAEGPVSTMPSGSATDKKSNKPSSPHKTGGGG